MISKALAQFQYNNIKWWLNDLTEEGRQGICPFGYDGSSLSDCHFCSAHMGSHIKYKRDRIRKRHAPYICHPCHNPSLFWNRSIQKRVIDLAKQYLEMLEQILEYYNYMDTMIIVCASCYRASCWHGLHLCQDYKHAGKKAVSRRELLKSKNEHRSYILTQEEHERHYLTGELPKYVR